MPETAVSSIFLRAKLDRPLLPDDYVMRPRLLAELEKIWRYRLALLTAPAGYGKSILASTWIEQVHFPGAWLSLDEGDDDLVVFIGYFVAAIQSIFPGFGEQILTVATSTSRSLLPTISSYLVGEIDHLAQDFVLVLDDVHLLSNLEIHELLGGLLQYPLPHFHLVLISRHDPPQQISKLRAKSRILELRAKDLLFSQTEVANFIEKTLPSLLDEDTIKRFTDKTEGWPVGLRLATIAIRRWGVDDYQPAILQVENPYVLEYLVNEVLTRQPTAVRDFLLKSAILDRFCTPFCAAVMGTDSIDSNFLPQLEKEGLFIESLGNQKEWYRYHHLFRDLLRTHLEEEASTTDIAVLHLRASEWLAANGFLETAIDQALASGDELVAANILAAQSTNIINKERWLLLENLLNKFPPAVINENPKLLLLFAWLTLTKMQLAQLGIIRERLERYLESNSLTSEEARFLACSIIPLLLLAMIGLQIMKMLFFMPVKHWHLHSQSGVC